MRQVVSLCRYAACVPAAVTAYLSTYHAVPRNPVNYRFRPGSTAFTRENSHILENACNCGGGRYNTEGMAEKRAFLGFSAWHPEVHGVQGVAGSSPVAPTRSRKGFGTCRSPLRLPQGDLAVQRVPTTRPSRAAAGVEAAGASVSREERGGGPARTAASRVPPCQKKCPKMPNLFASGRNVGYTSVG